MKKKDNIVFIGIGANKGEPERSCIEAIETLKRWHNGTVLQVSSLYKSEPWGYEYQDWFVNCVIKIKTYLDAFRVLSLLQKTEQSLGKQKDFFLGPRTIDLDLLFFNDQIIHKPHLKVPHPFLHQRRFVLEPLAELAPDFVHPVLKQSIGTLLEDLKDSKKVFKIKGDISCSYE